MVSRRQAPASSWSLASGRDPIGSRVFSVSMLTLLAHIARSSLADNVSYAPSSELEYLVVLQHPRAVLPGIFFDFLHRELDFSRFQVSDVDLRAALELGKLLGEHARAQVFRDDREFLLLVAEGGLDDQVLEVGDLIHDGPKRIVGRRVSGEHQASLARV